MKLTQISLENFKSHKKSEFELKPITIFIGPNSCGKSSILQSLLMLKNTFNPSPRSSEYLATKTDSYDFGNFDDSLSKLDVSQEQIKDFKKKSKSVS